MLRGVESDAVKMFEAHPAEDVEMDLAGTVIPDDECGKIGSHAHSQKSGAPQCGVVVLRFTAWWSQ